MSLRIRQIVFAARDLQQTVAQFQHALGLRVSFRDPAVAKFGLENALLTIGDQFIEIVSPTQPDSAAGRHLDRHGDSAYMLILQTDDLASDRARLQRLGVRIVWESHHEEISALHLHPKDIGAAIVSLDQATPPASWRWAGPDWQAHASSDRRVVSATISARDPNAMCKRWSEVLGLGASANNQCELPLTDGALLFNSSPDGPKRITQFCLQVPRATSPIELCGTRFTFVSNN